MNELVTKDIELEKYINNFLSKCAIETIVNYNYNLLNFENSSFFIVDKTNMYQNKPLQVLYTNILENICTSLFVDLVVTFSDPINLIYNNVFTFTKNRNITFIKNAIAEKRNILGLNNILKLAEDMNDKSINVLFPIMFINFEDFKKITSWINVLQKIINIKNFIILPIFELNLEDSVKDQIYNDIHDLKTKSEINILYIPIIDKQTFFDILHRVSIISNEQYAKIKIFIQPNTYLNDNKKDKQTTNPLSLHYNKLVSMKKSRLCISLDNINDVNELIKYTNLLGSYICAIKINTNFIFNEKILVGLRKLADHHKFLIIDDKKLILKSMDDLQKINVFSYVDIVTLNFDFIDLKIEDWFKLQRKSNPNASFAINFSNFKLDNDLETKIALKQYSLFNSCVFGIIGLETNHNRMFTIINYKHLNNLNDNFINLKQADMVVLEGELYKVNNPIDIVTKINSIMQNDTGKTQ